MSLRHMRYPDLGIHGTTKSGLLRLNNPTMNFRSHVYVLVGWHRELGEEEAPSRREQGPPFDGLPCVHGHQGEYRDVDGRMSSETKRKLSWVLGSVVMGRRAYEKMEAARRKAASRSNNPMNKGAFYEQWIIGHYNRRIEEFKRF